MKFQSFEKNYLRYNILRVFVIQFEILNFTALTRVVVNHYLMDSRSPLGREHIGLESPPPRCLCRCVLGRGEEDPPPGDSSDLWDTDPSSPHWLNSSGTRWSGWSGCYWSPTCTSIQLDTRWKSFHLYQTEEKCLKPFTLDKYNLEVSFFYLS